MLLEDPLVIEDPTFQKTEITDQVERTTINNLRHVVVVAGMEGIETAIVKATAHQNMRTVAVEVPAAVGVVVEDVTVTVTVIANIPRKAEK